MISIIAWKIKRERLDVDTLNCLPHTCQLTPVLLVAMLLSPDTSHLHCVNSHLPPVACNLLPSLSMLLSAVTRQLSLIACTPRFNAAFTSHITPASCVALCSSSLVACLLLLCVCLLYCSDHWRPCPARRMKSADIGIDFHRDQL